MLTKFLTSLGIVFAAPYVILWVREKAIVTFPYVYGRKARYLFLLAWIIVGICLAALCLIFI